MFRTLPGKPETQGHAKRLEPVANTETELLGLYGEFRSSRDLAEPDEVGLAHILDFLTAARASHSQDREVHQTSAQSLPKAATVHHGPRPLQGLQARAPLQ